MNVPIFTVVKQFNQETIEQITLRSSLFPHDCCSNPRTMEYEGSLACVNGENKDLTNIQRSINICIVHVDNLNSAYMATV